MYVGFFVFVLGIAVCSCSTIPSYIPVCKRNDPKIEECIIKAIETLKPKLMKGIPELDIPALEPLVVPELIISRGGAYKAIGRNLVVKGASNFKVIKLKADIINIKYLVSVTIPKMDMEADYEVDAKILNLKFNGKGKIRGNATDAKADIILSGKKAKRDGKTYADFTGLEIDLKLGDYSVQIENLFNGNKELGSCLNALNIKVTFKTGNKLESKLKPPNRNLRDKKDKTGIYKITCDDCPSFYIGQTGRPFKKRFKEHLPTTKGKPKKSRYAEHLIDNCHNYSDIDNNMEILHTFSKGRYMSALEEFEIYKAFKQEPKNILNEQLSYSSNTLYDSVIKMQIKEPATQGDAINVAVNENKKEFMKELKPTVEKILEKLFLDVAQKITSHFTYDDLFPVK